MSSPGKGKIRLLRILTGLNVFSQNPVACGFNVSGGGDGAMEMVRVGWMRRCCCHRAGCDGGGGVVGSEGSVESSQYLDDGFCCILGVAVTMVVVLVVMLGLLWCGW